MRFVLLLAALIVALTVPLIGFGWIDLHGSMADQNSDMLGLLGLSISLYIAAHVIGERP